MINSVLKACILGFEFLDLLIFGVLLNEGGSGGGLVDVSWDVFELLEEGFLEFIKVGKDFFLELL